MRSRSYLLMLLTAAFSAQSQTFEVASIRPGAPGARGVSIRPAPGGIRYEAGNATLMSIMAAAWRVKSDQVVGGPAWFETDRFDLQAKADHPSDAAELNAMLRNLLAERFHLRVHTETRATRSGRRGHRRGRSRPTPSLAPCVPIPAQGQW